MTSGYNMWQYDLHAVDIVKSDMIMQYPNELQEILASRESSLIHGAIIPGRLQTVILQE